MKLLKQTAPDLIFVFSHLTIFTFVIVMLNHPSVSIFFLTNIHTSLRKKACLLMIISLLQVLTVMHGVWTQKLSLPPFRPSFLNVSLGFFFFKGNLCIFKCHLDFTAWLRFGPIFFSSGLDRWIPPPKILMVIGMLTSYHFHYHQHICFGYLF